MSSPAKFSLLALCLLAGCGFQPLYGSGTASLASAGVYVDPINAKSKTGQQFKFELEDKLNPAGKVPDDPAYRLAVSLSHTVSAIGVATDGTVSRYNVSLNSTYVLSDYKTGKQITSGTLQRVNSYNNRINEYFSTYISSEDALKQGVTALSETYRQRLAPYLNGQRPPEKEVDKPA